MGSPFLEAMVGASNSSVITSDSSGLLKNAIYYFDRRISIPLCSARKNPASMRGAGKPSETLFQSSGKPFVVGLSGIGVASGSSHEERTVTSCWGLMDNRDSLSLGESVTGFTLQFTDLSRIWLGGPGQAEQGPRLGNRGPRRSGRTSIALCRFCISVRSQRRKLRPLLSTRARSGRFLQHGPSRSTWVKLPRCACG